MPPHPAAPLASAHALAPASQLNGEMYRIGNHTEAPFKREALPNLQAGSITSHMFELAVTPFTGESTARVFRDAGLLKHTTTQADVPPTVPFALNTETFQMWAPDMYKKWPSTPMSVVTEVVADPTVAFEGGSCTASASTSFTFVVTPDNEPAVPAFAIAVR